MDTKKEESTIVGRKELTRSIALQANLTQKQAGEVLEATLDSIREALQNGDEVRLVGFGSFKVRESAARTAISPRDRTPLEVPAKNRVRFTAGKDLNDAIIGGGGGGRRKTGATSGGGTRAISAGRKTGATGESRKKGAVGGGGGGRRPKH